MAVLAIAVLAGSVAAESTPSIAPGLSHLFADWFPDDEFVELRTSSSRTFDNHDGSRSVVVFGMQQPASFDEDTVQVGDSSRRDCSMWFARYNYFRAQHLYLASELNFDGTIVGLSFFSDDSSSDTLNRSHHWLRDLSDTEFADDEWVEPGHEVWSDDLLREGTGWLALQLEYHFHHSRDSNLLVSYRHRDSTGQWLNFKFYHTTPYRWPAGLRAKRGFGDTDTLPRMTRVMYRANTRITYVPTPQPTDAQTISILAPADSVVSGQSHLPRAVVRNNGAAAVSFPVRFRISDGYCDTCPVNGLEPGLTDTVEFASWTAGTPGRLTVSCSTQLAGDQHPENDQVLDSIMVVLHDVGAERVLAPAGAIARDSPVQSMVVVRNYGSADEAVGVNLAITRDSTTVRSDSLQVHLAAGASIVCTFALWRADQIGDYRATGTTILPGDMNPANDTASAAFRVFYRDVAVTGVLAPRDTLAWDSLVVPRVRVVNMGSETEMPRVRLRIEGTSYSDSSMGMLPPGDSAEVSFRPWRADTGHVRVVASVSLAGDRNPANDSAWGNCVVLLRDVGASCILVPVGIIEIDSTVVPAVLVRNYGNVTAEFPVLFLITGPSGVVYAESTQAALGAGDSAIVEFPAWRADTVGDFTATSFTRLASDQRRENDTAQSGFLVRHVLRHDVGVSRIIAPRDSMAQHTVVEPRALVRNLGREGETFPVEFRIENGAAVYCDTQEANLASGESLSVGFAAWPANLTGYFRSCCRTRLDGDEDSLNDAAADSFRVYGQPLHDVAVVRIVSPAGTIDTGSAVRPSAEVRNLGDFIEAGWMRFSIPEAGYADPVPLSGLQPGETRAVSFAPWTPHAAGIFTARCSVWVPEDECRENDTLAQQFDVQVPSPWSRMADLPLGSRSRRAKAGGALVVTADEKFLALKGNRTREFYGYDSDSNRWESLCSLPGPKPVGRGGTMTDLRDENRVYAVKGGNSPEFWCRVPECDSWFRRADVPTGNSGWGVRGGACLAALDSGPVFLLKGGGQEFFQYDPNRDEWQRRASPPGGMTRRGYRDGSCLIAVRDYLYLVKGRDNDLFAYSTLEDTWYLRLALPGSGSSRGRTRAGTAIAHDRDVIYVLKGGRSSQLWRYCTFGDTWNELDPVPVGANRRSVGAGGALAFAAGKLWAMKGNNTVEFYSHRSLASPAASLEASSGVMSEPGGPTEDRSAGLAIWPNPGSDRIAVRWFGDPVVRLRDILGREVLRARSHSGRAVLNVAGLPRGVYLVEVAGQSGRLFRKLVLR